MSDFDTIYKILAILKSSMDCYEFDNRLLSSEHLGVSPARRMALLRMLVEEGYIKGIAFDESAGGDIMESVARPRITLKGLEYLENNTLMEKAYRAAKGIRDLLP